MVIAIDFDGVIHDYKNPIKGRRMGLPIEGALEGLKKFKNRGDTIIIHSCKAGDPSMIEKWMTYYNIPYYDSITNIKPIADVYLDDKAIRFENWKNLIL